MIVCLSLWVVMICFVRIGSVGCLNGLCLELGCNRICFRLRLWMCFLSGRILRWFGLNFGWGMVEFEMRREIKCVSLNSIWFGFMYFVLLVVLILWGDFVSLECVFVGNFYCNMVCVWVVFDIYEWWK